MRVLKFGGSSVADAARLRAAARIVATHRREAPVTVVVSAMAGVTDALLTAGHAALAGDTSWKERLAVVERRHRNAYRELVGTVPAEFDLAWRDLLEDARRLSQQSLAPTSVESLHAVARFSGRGERLAVPLFAAALDAASILAQPFAAEPVLLETSAASEEPPRPSALATRGWLVPRVARLVMRGVVLVLPGYIARDAAGQGTTLGRNGSDHSAAVIAAALGAESVYIYSDVAGFFSADPHVVPEAALLPSITYAEAAEVAWLGARVLHPRTLAPLAHWGIPLYLRSSLAPDAPGTDILPTMKAVADTAWVVAARPAADGTERHRVEVTATLLGDALRTLDEGEPLLAAVARHLSASPAPAPAQVLDVSPRQLRLLVPSASAQESQRALHAALVHLGRPHAAISVGCDRKAH